MNYTQPTGEEMARFVRHLENIGFFSYTDAVERLSVKRSAIHSGSLFGDERSGRVLFADAEDLAEGGVLNFLSENTSLLTKLGIVINSISHDFSDHGYSVTVNDTTYIMYTSKDLENGGIWELTATHTAALLNVLIEKVRTEVVERFYQVYGGNDHTIVLLTKEQYNAIKQSGLFDIQEIPFEPNAIYF